MTTHTTNAETLGDCVPERVAEYYTALDEARFDDAVDCFSENVLYAAPAPGVIETGSRNESVGRDALRARFEARGASPRAHEVLLCVVAGPTCLVEGLSRATPPGEASLSFVASMELDGAGLIARYLAYATSPPVVPLPGDVAAGATSPGDAAEVLDRYFHALDRGAFEEAAACFSESVLYSHPPYRHTGIDSNQRVEFRGRAELLAKFGGRGPQTFDHRLLACIQRGPHCMVEGLVEGLPEGGSGSFISSLTLDGRGLIGRYLSFYCEPSVRVA